MSFSCPLIVHSRPELLKVEKSNSIAVISRYTVNIREEGGGGARDDIYSDSGVILFCI